MAEADSYFEGRSGDLLIVAKTVLADVRRPGGQGPQITERDTELLTTTISTCRFC